MTKNEKQAQTYLIVRDVKGKREIVNIRKLLRSHSTHEIVQFLGDLYKEQEKQLQSLIATDKTNHQIDNVVSKMFRLHMAISLLKESTIADREAA
jgi:hypothetical protein